MSDANPAPPGTHLSRLLISRLVADDLEPDEIRRVEIHLAACAVCSKVFMDAKQQASGFPAAYPAREYPSAARRSRRNPAADASHYGQRLRAALSGGGLRPAFAILILLFAGWALFHVSQPPEPESTAKGEARFYLFVNGRAAAGDTLAIQAGDTLQLGLSADEPVHYAIYYRDDGGSLEPYFPPGGAPLGKPDGEHLPHSLVLDGGWREEVLYCLWSRSPLSVTQAQAAVVRAEGGAPVDPPAGGPMVRRFVLRNSGL